MRLPRRRRPLELDFLHPGASTANRPVQLALFALSIPLLAMAIAGYEQEARTVREQGAAVELAAPRPQRRPTSADASPAQARARAGAAAQMSAIQAQLNYPWQSFLGLLESAEQQDVALLALEPDWHSGVTRIGAEARNIAAMLNYLDELQKSGAFDDVVLASHELEVHRPGTPIRFDLQAHWHAGFRLARHPEPQAPPRVQPLAASATGAAPALPTTALATVAGGH